MRDIRFMLKTHYTGSHALIIGINKYLNASPLGYAVSDAEEMKTVLTKELGFDEGNVTYLTDGEATRENIFKAYMKYAGEQYGIDDRIIVFFAGHGFTTSGIRGEVGYLVPCDGDPKDLSTLIRWDDLTRNSEIIRPKHILFIMDACYSGLALTRHTGPGSARFIKDMMLRYSRQVITAGKANEVVADAGGPLPNHSIFTGHLIEGIRGKASGENDILTASGLMAYVYNKVATDKNSGQTPHYGHFDGDGDFIIKAPILSQLEGKNDIDIDRLVVVPYPEVEEVAIASEDKVLKVKRLLSNESSSIELHDFLIEEIRRFLSMTSDDNFKVSGASSKEDLLERMAKYEKATNDLSSLLACLSYWYKSAHKNVLQKVISSSTDRLDDASGLRLWLDLRWYPMILEIYISGIAAIASEKYDALHAVFSTKLNNDSHRNGKNTFVEAVGRKMSDLANVFKSIPGHERYHVPMSEYLFKILQPQLDEILFMGRSYEGAFDNFEVMLALALADLNKQNDNNAWGPVGRFGWKQARDSNPPLSRIIKEAKDQGRNWGPLKAGMFGGDIDRFTLAADEYKGFIDRLSWF